MPNKGNVTLGRDCNIQENVILGHANDGRIVLGDNAMVRSGTIIYSNVKIGNNFKTGHEALIRENTEIGDNVLIGSHSVVDGNCKIGNNVSVQTAAYITAFTTIEDDVFIGPRVVTTNDKYMYVGAKLIGATIKKGARIGANATILPGITIGSGAVVGSASVVTRDVPAGAVVVGNPARVLKKEKVEIKGSRKKIAVIGMGYVGIPMAVLLASAGHDVTGIERKSKRSGWKIDWLNEGRCPIGGNEPELPELLKTSVTEGKFRVTDDCAAVKDADIILIDVQTPTNERHIPKYESLKEVCHTIGKLLLPGKVVIIESTVAPGTTEYLVKPILEQESGLTAGLPEGFGLCFSYERVMVGRLIHNIREYPKIVGGIDESSIKTAVDMYRSVVNGEVLSTNIMTAEVSKTVENAYRDVQIAFANEVALLCESLGIDVYDVKQFVNGLPNDTSAPHANPLRNMHFPGAGVGGHCLPKDTWLLMYGFNKYAAEKNHYPFSVLKDARHINDFMPIHMANLVESGLREAQKDVKGSKVCVLGYAFLENSDDARNSPTAPLLKELAKRGLRYTVHDPFVRGEEDVQIENDIDIALKNSDAIVLMTKHKEYEQLNPARLKGLMKTNVLVDGRNMFNAREFIAEGFIFKGVGKGNVNRLGRLEK